VADLLGVEGSRLPLLTAQDVAAGHD